MEKQKSKIRIKSNFCILIQIKLTKVIQDNLKIKNQRNNKYWNMQVSNEQKSKQSSSDELNLNNQPNIQNQLGQKQIIKYSTMIKKINDQGMIQQRIFLLTNQAIYNIAKKSSIIKSIVSKLITLQSKYTIKRKIFLKQLYGITLSKAKQNGEFILHVIDDNDYRYCAQNHQKKVNLLKILCQVYTLYTNKKLAFYFKDQIVLTQYLTTKCDVKSKINKKPQQDPVYLTYQDFQNYELPDLNYKLQYSKDIKHNNINMKSFKPIFQIQKLQSNINYFTLSTQTLNLKNILQLTKLKSKYLLQPQFIFSTKNKVQLITPFMIGGNLAKKLKQSIKVSQYLAYFYIAQLICILQEFQPLNIFYGNFCLQKILINQNGYLRIQGINQHIKIHKNNQMFYDIVGYPPYIAPQMIFVKGYNHKVNLWRLGICAYYLLTGSYPFEGNTTKKIYNQILTKKIKPQAPQFLHKLLQKDPNKRISLQQLKQYPKFNEFDWTKLRQQTILAPYQPDISSWKGNLPSIVHLKLIN